MKTKTDHLTTAREYKKTKNGLIAVIYSSQKTNSKQRGHCSPTYSKEDLSDWLHSQKLFHVLYDNWKRLDYQKEYKPSVDRKDDYFGYTMSNIQLMTWGENMSKGHKNIADGVGTQGKKCVSVLKFTEDGDFLQEYHSIHEAGRKNNTSYQNIHKCCNHKRSHAGGFVWIYK